MACRGVIWKLLRISFLISLSGVLGQEILLPRRGNGFFELTAAESSCLSPDPSLYYLPVIGIVTHPGDGASGRLSNATNASNIPASYVKFVESAGARVIPLIYNEPWEVILDKLSLVNGVLFTGGWCKKGLYFETVKKIFQITLDRNDAGDHFPLFGICLGFELLSMIITKDNNFCERFSGENQASTLQFPDYVNIQGSVFERFPSELLKKLSRDCLAMQNHMYGISPKSLQENDALSSFFRILTTSTDANGEVYISTAQAYNYPVTGFQWHPEDNNFCERFSGENQASTLQFPDYVNIQGSVFERFPSELLKKLSRDCLAMQNHMYGISPKSLQENDALSSFFRILTTSTDANGEVYISTAQAYNYPVTGFQWHPELVIDFTVD
ncbi:Gamma-glutamyl hydrolase [Cocos nucifera]|uniref:folate gamma-glutamyl hydrolase n=1 Tax=Cocos nucifera TaxID=13894 RepID=A0A8K0IU28_COCNU|nr:Gamma-glutamyl hydrolase [Cocos nucifera]